jgi:hypothetical protein
MFFVKIKDGSYAWLDLGGNDWDSRPRDYTKQKYNPQILLRYLVLENHRKLVCIFSYKK